MKNAILASLTAAAFLGMIGTAHAEESTVPKAGQTVASTAKPKKHGFKKANKENKEQAPKSGM